LVARYGLSMILSVNQWVDIFQITGGSLPLVALAGFQFPPPHGRRPPHMQGKVFFHLFRFDIETEHPHTRREKKKLF